MFLFRTIACSIFNYAFAFWLICLQGTTYFAISYKLTLEWMSIINFLSITFLTYWLDFVGREGCLVDIAHCSCQLVEPSVLISQCAYLYFTDDYY